MKKSCLSKMVVVPLWTVRYSLLTETGPYYRAKLRLVWSISSLGLCNKCSQNLAHGWRLLKVELYLSRVRILSLLQMWPFFSDYVTNKSHGNWQKLYNYKFVSYLREAHNQLINWIIMFDEVWLAEDLRICSVHISDENTCNEIYITARMEINILSSEWNRNVYVLEVE